MSRLSEIFGKHEKCFLPFVTAGHPSLEDTERIILQLVDAGSHIVEIGIPFSDPIADGPTIQRSSFDALGHGYSLSQFIQMVARIRQRTDAGLIFMSYLNPLLRFGLERLESEAAAAGLDGILISDLTPEEYGHMPAFQKLETVFLAAPTSTQERLKSICQASTGFVYLVARTGVTGPHTELEQRTLDTLGRLRKLTVLPIALGFGIDSRQAVQEVWKVADGAVVGSAIVRYIEEHRRDPDLAKRVGAFVKGLIP